jgi:hypothetical protein
MHRQLRPGENAQKASVQNRKIITRHTHYETGGRHYEQKVEQYTAFCSLLRKTRESKLRFLIIIFSYRRPSYQTFKQGAVNCGTNKPISQTVLFPRRMQGSKVIMQI